MTDRDQELVPVCLNDEGQAHVAAELKAPRH